MGTTEQRIFWGTFSSDSDDFLLQEVAGARPLVQVTYSPVSDVDEGRVGSLADSRQQVSILGHQGQPAMTELGTLPSIVAERIVSHEDVARRAFEIYESGRGGSAFDNWLVAERQLLGF